MRVSNTELSVLIQGERGVGKEIFSKIIHELSKRKHNKFIAINCGAIPEGTINSELFGHERGSFTGATADRSGYFETVDGGTIFLDEIGEMPLDTQAYLLRVLESGEILKVDTGCIVGFDQSVDYDIEFVGGIKNTVFGGEGLFFAKLQGPGTVYIQSLPFSRLAGRVLASAPRGGGKNKGEGSILGGLGDLLDGDNRF